MTGGPGIPTAPPNKPPNAPVKKIRYLFKCFLYLTPSTNKHNRIKVKVEAINLKLLTDINVSRNTPTGSVKAPPNTKRKTSLRRLSRITLGIFGSGPIKSIIVKTIITSTGLRTCPAIGIKIIALPNPENPLTTPANDAAIKR